MAIAPFFLLNLYTSTGRGYKEKTWSEEVELYEAADVVPYEYAVKRGTSARATAEFRTAGPALTVLGVLPDAPLKDGTTPSTFYLLVNVKFNTATHPRPTLLTFLQLHCSVNVHSNAPRVHAPRNNVVPSFSLICR